MVVKTQPDSSWKDKGEVRVSAVFVLSQTAGALADLVSPAERRIPSPSVQGSAVGCSCHPFVGGLYWIASETPSISPFA